MIIGISLFFAFLAGFAAASWAAEKLPLPSAHELCDEKFLRMQARLRHEIEVREKEIQRLVQGQT